MTNFKNKRGSKCTYKAHTVRDDRYKRSNKVKMYSCPSCSDKGGLREIKEGKYVWADCLRCGESGYSCKINDNHLTECIDIYYL